MDVVALAQHGVDYAVATLGTATTPVHAQKLFRLTDTVVYCFDGDAAGRKAAWRALENTLPVLADGKNALFLFLPDGEDPDDFVRKRGKAAFEALFERATPLSEFLHRRAVGAAPADLGRGPRRARACRAAATWRSCPRRSSRHFCAGDWPSSPACRKRELRGLLRGTEPRRCGRPPLRTAPPAPSVGPGQRRGRRLRSSAN